VNPDPSAGPEKAEPDDVLFDPYVPKCLRV